MDHTKGWKKARCKGRVLVWTCCAGGGSLCGIAAPLGYGLTGDHIGVTNAVALMGIAILFTLPLCAVLKPTISAEPVSI